jgi:predicted transcriptional regulator YdeE
LGSEISKVYSNIWKKMNKRLTRIYCTPDFKKWIYSKKSEEPDKPLVDILDEIAKKDNKFPFKKKRNFWGKI